MAQISFCALIVNYHGKDDTVSCVESLINAAQSSEAKVNVVIVDNSKDVFDFEEESIHIIRTGHNVGLSGAWYVGFYSEAAQSCDFVILLNNDTYVAENFFAELQIGIEKWGPNCAFGPCIYHASNHDLIWSRGGRINRFQAKVKHQGESVPVQSVEPGDFETGHLSGCCMVLSIDHLNQIGGPDTNFFFRGEEWDLNYRLMKCGIRLVILDNVKVYHQINGSHSRFSPNMLYFAYRAKVLFAKKILPWWYFPVWFSAALFFATFVAPIRFARESDRDTSTLRRSLVWALIDGLKSDKILPPKEKRW